MRAMVGLGVALLVASPVVFGLGVVQASTQDAGGSDAQQPVGIHVYVEDVTPEEIQRRMDELSSG